MQLVSSQLGRSQSVDRQLVGRQVQSVRQVVGSQSVVSQVGASQQLCSRQVVSQSVGRQIVRYSQSDSQSVCQVVSQSVGSQLEGSQSVSQVGKQLVRQLVENEKCGFRRYLLIWGGGSQIHRTFVRRDLRKRGPWGGENTVGKNKAQNCLHIL